MPIIKVEWMGPFAYTKETNFDSLEETVGVYCLAYRKRFIKYADDERNKIFYFGQGELSTELYRHWWKDADPLIKKRLEKECIFWYGPVSEKILTKHPEDSVDLGHHTMADYAMAAENSLLVYFEALYGKLPMCNHNDGTNFVKNVYFLQAPDIVLQHRPKDSEGE